MNCELPTLMQRADDKELDLKWFCVSPCAYDATDLQRVQASANPAEPLVSLDPSHQGGVLLNVARAVRDSALSPRGDWIKNPA